MKRALYVWCYIAYRIFLILPMARRHETPYGRLMLWLLSFAGAYAHTNGYADFNKMVRF